MGSLLAEAAASPGDSPPTEPYQSSVPEAEAKLHALRAREAKLVSRQRDIDTETTRIKDVDLPQARQTALIEDTPEAHQHVADLTDQLNTLRAERDQLDADRRVFPTAIRKLLGELNQAKAEDKVERTRRVRAELEETGRSDAALLDAQKALVEYMAIRTVVSDQPYGNITARSTIQYIAESDKHKAAFKQLFVERIQQLETELGLGDLSVDPKPIQRQLGQHDLPTYQTRGGSL